MRLLRTVLLVLVNLQNLPYGFRIFKYQRSVDTNKFSSYIPQSPCPHVFQYQYDESSDIIGIAKVNEFNHSGKILLEIELSVGNSVQGYNGKIVLADNKENIIRDLMYKRPIFYKVLFPMWQNIPPRVTKMSVNNKIICTGPKIPIQLVPVLTTITLQHKLTLGITPLTSSSDSSLTDSSTFKNFTPVFGSAENQYSPTNTIYPIDVRVDNQPTVPNKTIIVDTEKTNGTPNQFNGVSNPFGFNPQSTPIEKQVIISNKPNKVFPQNPFFSIGFSTPEPLLNEDKRKTEEGNMYNTDLLESSTAFNFQGPKPETPLSGRANRINNVECGRPLATNSLIVNGNVVPMGAYPWLVAIFRQVDNLSLSYICSGSLVSDRHVITAAHCVKFEYRRIKPNELVCVFGKLNIRKWVSSPEEKILEPESIIVHPDYKTGTANADIAVLTFPDPIQFSKFIRPVCLWSGSSELSLVVGNIGTVVGWGRDENGDVSTAEPRQVELPIVSQENCLRSDKGSTGAFVHITSDKTFCAGFRNGSGPCNGDSGSGFLLQRSGVFYLRGIVSTALSDVTHRSCNLQEYVVFTDASKYLDWLLSVMVK